ncbi:MAG: SDR family NAD(P)-dependent oxidoreductase [Pseudomonadota bacterium]
MGSFFQDRHVVVTGAGSGIGRALVQALSAHGARVAALDLKAASLQPLALLPGVLPFTADVADGPRMAEVARQVHAEFGRVDLVVANAGVGGLNPGYAFSTEIHQRTVDINVMGLVHSLAPYIPKMVERGGGHLVGISSLASFRGLPGAGSYSSTKAAQRILLESLRVDLKPRGVAVSCICPGFVKTAMTEHDEFPLPFMVPVDRAAQLILRAIQHRRSLYLFPWPMRLLTLFNRLLPDALFDWLLPRLSRADGTKQARIF